MARKPTGKPVGPPPKDISIEKFEELCGLWCTSEEIAASFKIHLNTLKKRVVEHYGEEYSQIYKRMFDNGTPSFRRERRVLSKRNANMSIWLGKIHLGEKEHQDKEDAPKEEDLLLKQQYYATLYENQQLKKELDDLKSQTSQELQSSDTSI